MAEEFIFVHLVATVLPDVAELLQHGAYLLARGDPQPPQVVAADGEAGDGPAAELRQQLLLVLVLQQLTHFTLRVQLPTLKRQENLHSDLKYFSVT